MTSQDSQDEETTRTLELVEGGSELAGASLGAAIGLIGGPPGAVGGAAAGILVTRGLKKIGADLHRRRLGPLEEVRIGAATAIASARIAAYLEAGETPRQDGFFESDSSTQRPSAEELLEGVLLKARDAYEERKVRYLGNLYAHVAFLESISLAHANYLVELAAQLTFRQLVFLAISGDEESRIAMRDGDYRNDAEAIAALGQDGQSLLSEVYDLYQRGLIGGGGEAWISLPDVNPRQARAQGSGATLVALMGLGEIPNEERSDVLALFAA